MSASDNLSTKCSGLLLRSSFAFLAARTRHLTNVDRMPAFSVASRPRPAWHVRGLKRDISRGPPFAERYVMECLHDRIGLEPDVGRSNQHGPFLRFVGNELAEVGRPPFAER